MKLNIPTLDRRIIYLLVLLSLAVPLVKNYSLPAAKMDAAQKLFDVIDTLSPGPSDVALVAMDFGPSILAENGPQTEVIIEHLMRRRIPVALFSVYPQAAPFLVTIPEKVAKNLEIEIPDQSWEYGTDWVNLGYRPGGALTVQAVPKSENLVELFGKDARGNSLKDLPAFQGVKTLKNIVFLAEITGLVGVFDTYIQFFQNKEYRPLFGHGCTSITIPEAFIYLDSGQIKGLLEGFAGAAWYSTLLKRKYPNRATDESLMIVNTGIGVAQLVIVFLIILGNIASFFSRGGLVHD